MISFIIPTIGRDSLYAAVYSTCAAEGDEIIVVGCADVPYDRRVNHISCVRGNDWGATERTLGIQTARGTHLAFMDDDDIYLPGARQAMAAAIWETPDKPVLFRIRYPNGRVLWADPALRCGNVSTQMMLIPNVPEMLGVWSKRREGDFDFLASMRFGEIVFREEIIAAMGHNDG